MNQHSMDKVDVLSKRRRVVLLPDPDLNLNDHDRIDPLRQHFHCVGVCSRLPFSSF